MASRYLFCARARPLGTLGPVALVLAAQAAARLRGMVSAPRLVWSGLSGRGTYRPHDGIDTEEHNLLAEMVVKFLSFYV